MGAGRCQTKLACWNVGRGRDIVTPARLCPRPVVPLHCVPEERAAHVDIAEVPSGAGHSFGIHYYRFFLPNHELI